MQTCKRTLWGPIFLDIKHCGEPAVGDWERTPVCEKHLAEHPDAKRWTHGERERQDDEGKR